jgi:hypothetical protein
MKLRRSTTILFIVGALAAVGGAPARADDVPPATSPVAAEVAPPIIADALPSPAAVPSPASAPTAAPEPEACNPDLGLADGGDAPPCDLPPCSLGLADGGDAPGCLPEPAGPVIAPDPPAVPDPCSAESLGLADGGDAPRCAAAG